jgi:hypothetical protein
MSMEVRSSNGETLAWENFYEYNYTTEYFEIQAGIHVPYYFNYYYQEFSYCLDYYGDHTYNFQSGRKYTVVGFSS